MEKRKILLADDSAAIRKVIEFRFAEEGIDVTAVSDGDAAMMAFVQNEPDLVIADVSMPGAGGLQICEMIKQDESTQMIPVVLLTGSYEPFDPQDAERVGADSYFVKPFESIQKVVDTVNDLLIQRDLRVAFETSGTEPFEHTVAELGFVGMDDMPDESPFGPVAEHEAVEAVNTLPEVFEKEPEVTAEARDEIDESASDDPITDVPPSEFSFDELVDDDATINIERLDGDSSASPAASGSQFADPFSSPAAVTRIEVPAAGLSDREVEATTNATPLPTMTAENTTASARQLTLGDVSPELLDEIVRRVVDQMSDDIVRDVAEQTVPRITQTLLREALDRDPDLSK